MMNAWGHTMFMISWSTYSDAADVLMLNPARFWSSAMVAVPPEDEDAFVDAPLAPGVTAITETLIAPAARAAKADRFNNPFSPIVLPCLPARPGDGRLPRTSSTLMCRKIVRKRNPIATFFGVRRTGISAGTRRTET